MASNGTHSSSFTFKSILEDDVITAKEIMAFEDVVTAIDGSKSRGKKTGYAVDSDGVNRIGVDAVGLIIESDFFEINQETKRRLLEGYLGDETIADLVALQFSNYGATGDLSPKNISLKDLYFGDGDTNPGVNGGVATDLTPGLTLVGLVELSKPMQAWAEALEAFNNAVESPDLIPCDQLEILAQKLLDAFNTLAALADEDDLFNNSSDPTWIGNLRVIETAAGTLYVGRMAKTPVKENNDGTVSAIDKNDSEFGYGGSILPTKYSGVGQNLKISLSANAIDAINAQAVDVNGDPITDIPAPTKPYDMSLEVGAVDANGQPLFSKYNHSVILRWCGPCAIEVAEALQSQMDDIATIGTQLPVDATAARLTVSS